MKWELGLVWSYEVRAIVAFGTFIFDSAFTYEVIFVATSATKRVLAFETARSSRGMVLYTVDYAHSNR